MHPSSKEERDNRGAAHERRMPASHATSPVHRSTAPPPAPPALHSLLTGAAKAPEDVEHAVERCSEAHVVAQGGAGAVWGQRRPGVAARAETVQVVGAGCDRWRGARARAHSRTGAGVAEAM
jgi:hypothetical protein